MFRDWYGGFWKQAGDALGLAPQVEVATDMNRYEIAPTGQRLHGSFFSSLDATPYRMLENRELLTRVAQSGPVAQSTRHIEFAAARGRHLPHRRPHRACCRATRPNWWDGPPRWPSSTSTNW